jgi:hypothetical protein
MRTGVRGCFDSDCSWFDGCEVEQGFKDANEEKVSKKRRREERHIDFPSKGLAFV